MTNITELNCKRTVARLPTVLLLTAVGPILYAVGTGAAMLDDRLPTAFCKAVAAVLTPAGAVVLLWVTPWLFGMLAFRRLESRRATAGAWSLAANSAALILLCLGLRNTVGVNRTSFLVAWLAWTAVLAWIGAASSTGRAAETRGDLRRLWQSWRFGALIGGLAAGAGIVLFAREHFFQCLDGDGTEAYELARSLRHHFLPYWEIEAVLPPYWEIETVGGFDSITFGTVVVYPALISSYWNLALQLLVDEVDVASRLAYWVWWLGVFAVTWNMTRHGDKPADWRPAIPLALAGLLSCIWCTFYVGYYAYMADLAGLPTADVLLTLLLLLALDCLRQEDLAGWVVMITAASLVAYAGFVLFVVTAAAAIVWQPVPRRRMFRAAAAGAAVLTAVVGFYLAWGWAEGSLAGWWATIREEYVKDFFAIERQSASRIWFACYFLVGCGVAPAVGLVWPPRRSVSDEENASRIGWKRTVATIALVYLLIVLKSQSRNLHYLIPLLPIPLVLWLREFRSAASVGRASAVATVGLAAGIFLCWPVARPTFTLNRQLGAVTTFQTDDYEEACRWSRIVSPMYHRGAISWDVPLHTWVLYSEVASEPDSSRPLVVTTGPRPSAQYELLFQIPSAKAKLYCRDPRWATWLKAQRPLTGPQRSPWIFQAIAVSPRPRRNPSTQPSNLP